MKLNARLEGLPALTARLSAVADAATLNADLRDTAEAIRRSAAANLDGAGSGALAASLTVSEDGAGGYTVATPLDAGWYLEFGTRARAARPWLAPAVDAARPGLLDRLRQRLTAVLRSAR